MYKIVIFIFLIKPILILGVIDNPYENQPCTTPTHLNGLCIFVQECPIIYEHRQKDVLYRDDLEFLYRSQCGYFDKRIMVCCPDTSALAMDTQNDTASKIAVEIQKNVNGLDLLPIPGICGSGSIPRRRRKRDQTRIFDHPWTVLLEYSKPDKSKEFHCSGTLINERYILTSSDCVSGEKMKENNLTLQSVRLGDWNLDEPNECIEDLCLPDFIDVEIEEFIYYKHSYLTNVSENANRKLALLRLTKEVEFSDVIKPLCLPIGENFEGNFYSITGNAFTISGWKKSLETPNSGFKVQANIRRTDFQRCEQYPDRKNCISNRKNSDLECQNYIGSPIMLRSMGSTRNENRVRTSWYLIGIISQASCNDNNWTGSYIEVPDYIGWILNEIKQ